MKKSYWILIILAVIIIVVVVLNWKNWFGKGSNGTHGTNGPKSTNNTNSNINAQAIADRLYELMDGLNLYAASRNEVNEILSKLLTISNNDFIDVWNSFGIRDGENLSQWVSGETYVSFALSEAIKNKALTLQLN